MPFQDSSERYPSTAGWMTTSCWLGLIECWVQHCAMQDQTGMDLIEAFSQEISGVESLLETPDNNRIEELLRTRQEMSIERAAEFATNED